VQKENNIFAGPLIKNTETNFAPVRPGVPAHILVHLVAKEARAVTVQFCDPFFYILNLLY